LFDILEVTRTEYHRWAVHC